MSVDVYNYQFGLLDVMCHIRSVFSDWCLSLGELSINVNGMLGPLLLFFLSSSPFMSINLFLMGAPLLGAYMFTLLYFLHGSIPCISCLFLVTVIKGYCQAITT